MCLQDIMTTFPDLFSISLERNSLSEPTRSWHEAEISLIRGQRGFKRAKWGQKGRRTWKTMQNHGTEQGDMWDAAGSTHFRPCGRVMLSRPCRCRSQWEKEPHVVGGRAAEEGMAWSDSSDCSSWLPKPLTSGLLGSLYISGHSFASFPWDCACLGMKVCS